MKHAKKYIVLPFDASITNPLNQYSTELDKNMSSVLNSNLPDDEKLKRYNNLLLKFKKNINFSQNATPIRDIIDNVKTDNQKTFNDLLSKVKIDNDSQLEKFSNQNKEIDKSFNKKTMKLIIHLKNYTIN